MIDLLSKIPSDIQLAPLPEQTSTYTPINHIGLIKYTAYHLDNAGIEVVDAKFSSAAKGNIMAGTMRVNKGNKDFSMEIGFINSYNKTRSVGYTSGGSILVCSNLMVVGDTTQLKKHSSNVAMQVEHMLDSQIRYLDNMFDVYAEDIEIMRSRQISKSLMFELIGEAFVERKIINTTQINTIRRELRESEHFKMLGPGGDMNLFNLYQNFTEALKTEHPSTYFKAHADARSLMLEAV